MKTLFSKITKNIFLPLAVATAFAFNSYSQKIEETENGFKQYNEKWQIIREKGKDNVQGITTSDFEYDDKGNVIKKKYLLDKNADGKEDYIETWLYEYDNKGNKIKEKFMVDNNADGKEDYIETLLWEHNNKEDIIKVKSMIDVNADGLIDKIEILK